MTTKKKDLYGNTMVNITYKKWKPVYPSCGKEAEMIIGLFGNLC
jgi:hypothetical protein